MATKSTKKVAKKRATQKDLKHLFGVGLVGNLQSFEDQLGVLNHPPETYEEVNHPKHYDLLPSGIECIDVIRHFDSDKGNAIKYIWRAGKKPGADEVKDLEKAIFYLTDRIKEVKGQHRQMK